MMPDETAPPEPTPISFTQYVALVVASWPKRTTFQEDWLDQGYLYGATVKGDVVTIRAANGTAKYVLRRAESQHMRGILADLVEGDSPSMLKRRAAKYEQAEAT